jgi:CHASE2 domain-containing sensor protein
MAKRVVLRMDGTLEQGFQATLEIGEIGCLPDVEATGSLPAAPELLESLEQWRTLYRQSSHPTRISLQQITVRMGALNRLEECHRVSKELQGHLQRWIESASFHSIDRQLRESLNVQEPVQVLLRARDRRLHLLPWHLWDFFERYSQAELALSAPPGRILPSPKNAQSTVKVLAILGDRRGIDTEADRQFLNHLPNAEITFLVEPSRQQITHQLWEQNWDILFFAGHSQTQENQGQIHLNPQESLTIAELNYGLRTAIANGLQLAIFNSCDGLGLAYELEQLHLPQLIVMREPVPDPVAQEFLKHVLNAFSQGKSLYQAVREARERLQGLEGQYPCASWLPIIYQNPTAMPLTWQTLRGNGEAAQPALNIPKFKTQNSKLKIPSLLRLFLTSLTVAASVFAVRHFGLLQPLEIAAFDQLMQLRPHEPPDPRILVILVTDEDLQAQPPTERRGSLSDGTLAQLLQRLNAAQPRAIGLDIYRDFAVQPKYPDLTRQLQQNRRLVAVCKVGNAEKQESGVAPPPEMPASQLAFSDLALDSDRVVRRHLLGMTPAPSSRCVAPYALSVQLALRYLDAEKISLKYPNADTWQFGKLSFHPLRTHTGGYQNVDDRGHQILLNYRSSQSPDRGIRQVTLGQVLRGEVNRDAIHDRVVLIGTIVEGIHDYWLTPYHTLQGGKQAIPGVVLQAQMTSQLLSAVLNKRPLLWAWTFWSEMPWILGWAVLGGISSWCIRKPTYLGLVFIGAIAALFSSCLLLLVQSGAWVPFVPAVMAFILSGISMRIIEDQINNTMLNSKSIHPDQG